jgi:superfamily II DNA/RNA helicase
MIVAPTREVANQIQTVVKTIGKKIQNLKCECFIGGTPIAADRKKIQGCHIVIGTPGRLQALIEEESFVTASVRVVILDEVDKLFDETFAHQTRQLLLTLPHRKQLLAFSATFESSLLKELESHMRNPTIVDLCCGDVKLKGVTQYVCRCDTPKNAYGKAMKKSEVLIDILNKTAFNQCLVFCNDRVRGEKLSKSLSSDGWVAALLHGSQSQQDRNAIMQAFRRSDMRILISSDLIARGVDVDRVNLVVNLDLPRDAETYMHRVGRTGRFGTFGIAISLVNSTEYVTLKKFRDQFELNLIKMPLEIPSDLYHFEDSNLSSRSAKDAVVTASTMKNEDSSAISNTSENSKKRKRNDLHPMDEVKKQRVEGSSHPASPVLDDKVFESETDFSSHLIPSPDSLPSNSSQSFQNPPQNPFPPVEPTLSQWSWWKAAQESLYYQSLWQQQWIGQMQWLHYLYSTKNYFNQESNRHASHQYPFPPEDFQMMLSLIQGRYPV